MLHFIFCPRETVTSKRNLAELLVLCVAFFLYNVLMAIGTYFVITVILNSSMPIMRHGSTTFSRFFFIFPCLLEEVAFRLPLVRNETNILISLVAFSFYLASFITYTSFFSTELIIPRVILTLLMGTVLFVLLNKRMLKVNYTLYFYSICVTFASFHLLNLPSWNLPVVIYSMSLFISKLIGGIMLGYLRIKYGIWSSLSLHLLYNYVV